MKERFADKIHQFIRREHLLPDGGRVLVALSGGADSVALLRVLHGLGYRCEAAHCNFHLRGSESQRDEDFAVALCRRLGVPLHKTGFDTQSHAAAHGVSIEMAARDLRYGYFDRLLRQLAIDCVAVGHHRDDNIETMLLNLMRGTGSQGLAGMKPRRDSVIRPMLCVSRKEIIDYLRDIGQDFVDDSSNAVADVRRNRIRLQLMPLLRDIAPAIDDTLCTTMRHIGEANDFMGSTLDTMLADCADGESPASDIQALSVRRLSDSGHGHLLLHHWLHRHGFNPSVIDDIWRDIDRPESVVYGSDSHDLARSHGQLLLRRRDQQPDESEEIVIDGIGTWQLPHGQLLTVSETTVEALGDIPRTPTIACLDSGTLQYPLRVGHWRQGDRFQPFGMTGSKLVSDYLADIKATPFERRRQLVLRSGGDIAWLIGRRPDQRHAIRPGKTEKVTKFCLDAK